MAIEKLSKIWMNGELVDWDDANVHVLTHALHYGTAALEGIRCYEAEKGIAVFRLTDHINRLMRSAKIMVLERKYNTSDLVDATKLLLRETGLREGYIRPLVYRGTGGMGLNPFTCDTDVLIAAWPWGSYHDPESAAKGLRVCTSSWQRINDNSLPPAAKTSANYQNSALAKVDSMRAGFDDAILLNQNGFVAEATAMNIFIVNDGVLRTPPLSSGALEGLRRDCVITVARDMGIEVREEDLRRTDLFLAEEAFVTGTAAELVPVASIDDREIGPRGPITSKIQETMLAAVRGKVDKYADWVEYV